MTLFSKYPFNAFFLSLVFLLLLGAVPFFYELDAYGLMHNNEGLYAQIPREMLISHTYVLPHLNGVPYIEKPPLLYWITAFFYTIGDISTFWARFGPALMGWLTCVGVFLFGWSQGKSQQGRVAAWVLMGCGAFSLFSRTVYFDGMLTFFLSASLWLYYLGSLRFSRWLLCFSYVFLAGAVLTKGLVAMVLYGLVVLAWTIVTRSIKHFFWLFSPGPLLVFFALVIPWHLLAHLQDPDFSWFYFINEHVLRFLGKRMPKDYYSGPIYYYIPRLFLYGLPWTLALIPALRWFVKKRVLAPGDWFCLCWALGFFLFFSLSQAKANYYVVTVMPPLAFVLANLLQRKEFSCPWLPMVFGGLLIGAGLVAWRYRQAFHLPGDLATHGKTLLWGGMALFILALLPLWRFARGEALVIITTLQTQALLVTALSVAPLYDPLISGRRFSITETKKCLYRDFEKMSSVVFYQSQGPMPIYQSVSADLAYGLHRMPQYHVHTPMQAMASCQGFFVFKDKVPSFKESFPDYGFYQSVGPVWYFQKPH